MKAGLADGTIDAIATDHAPHAPEAKELPFDQAPPGMLGLETALALALTELRPARSSAVLALLSWQPAAIAGLADRHGGPIAAGRPANLCVIDPDGHVGRRPGPPGQPQPQHALRRPHADGPGAPHDPARRTGRRRRRGPAMSAVTRRALLVLADGTTFEGEAIGADRRRCRHRRGRVQHRAVRLPGGHHRPVLRRPDHHLHLPAHRQLRRDRRRRREPAARSAGASSSATWPAGAATGAATATSTPSCAATACPASPASTPAASPATSATPAPCPAPSAPPTRRR